MKILTILGIVLVVLGGIVLAYDGITYTKEEQVVDIGPLEANVEETKRVPLPPFAGGIAIAAGIGLMLAGQRGKE